MVDALKYLQSDWLRAEDIEDDAPVVVTIRGVKGTKYKPDDQKEHLDVEFEEYKSPLGLNNKNLKQIVALLGRDTADWIGQRITLVVREVEVAGETKRAIRVDETLPRARRRRDDDEPRKRRDDSPPRRDDDDRPKPRRAERDSAGPRKARRADQ